MTTIELTQYLKTAAELEASVYRQTEILKSAQHSLKMDSPKTYYEPSPIKHECYLEEPEPPPAPLSCIVPTCFFLAISCIIACLRCLSSNYFEFGLCFLIPGAFFLLFGTIVYANAAIRKSKYNKQCEEHKKQVDAQNAIFEAEYNEEMKKYNASQEKAQQEYNRALTRAKTRYTSASAQIERLDKLLSETKTVLQELYSADIIYPKYRDFVAICTIYEYFQTGRCTELSGPNGAYNIYEYELRQNIIINRLDTVITKLDDISRNQYTLYNELKTLNTTAKKIANDISRICSSAKKIEESAAISAQCNAIIAKNTEALKYISLIS